MEETQLTVGLYSFGPELSGSSNFMMSDSMSDQIPSQNELRANSCAAQPGSRPGSGPFRLQSFWSSTRLSTTEQRLRTDWFTKGSLETAGQTGSAGLRQQLLVNNQSARVL